MDFTPILPKRFRGLTDGRHLLATGGEVDAILAASAARGYLLLPWASGGGSPRRDGVALRLYNRWWIDCDQRQQPFVVVNVRKAGLIRAERSKQVSDPQSAQECFFVR